MQDALRCDVSDRLTDVKGIPDGEPSGELNRPVSSGFQESSDERFG